MQSELFEVHLDEDSKAILEKILPNDCPLRRREFMMEMVVIRDIRREANERVKNVTTEI